MRPQPNNTRLARLVKSLLDKLPLVSRGKYRELQDRLHSIAMGYEYERELTSRFWKLSQALAEKRTAPLLDLAKDRSEPYLEVEPSEDEAVRTVRVVIPRLEFCFSEYVGWKPVKDLDEETLVAIRQLARRICAAHADHMEEHVLRRILAQQKG